MSPRPEDYTVGWICAVEVELVAACELLDEEYDRQDWPRIGSDQNSYHFGRIHEHATVIACLPKGRYGVTSAALVVQQMQHDFPSIRYVLMVGIGGGAPSRKNDIRLGDVVVSSPTRNHGGVLQYDFGKALQKHEFEITGHLSGPPQALLNALTYISAQHQRRDNGLTDIVDTMLDRNRRLRLKYSRPPPELDRLFVSSYVHTEQKDCACNSETDHSQQKSPILIDREPRPEDGKVLVHYGLIASANTLVKDAILRDSLIKDYDVFCFEMEAAGLMNDFPCIVIRGICDYSDSHKNDIWQGYAAAIAAAYAKELLGALRGLVNPSRKSTFDYSQNEASTIKQQSSMKDFKLSDSAEGSSSGSFKNPHLPARMGAEDPYLLPSRSTLPPEGYFRHNETDSPWNNARQSIFQLRSDTDREGYQPWDSNSYDTSIPTPDKSQRYTAPNDKEFRYQGPDIIYDVYRSSSPYRPIHNPDPSVRTRNRWKQAAEKIKKTTEGGNIHGSHDSAINDPRSKRARGKENEDGRESRDKDRLDDRTTHPVISAYDFSVDDSSSETDPEIYSFMNARPQRQPRSKSESHEQHKRGRKLESDGSNLDRESQSQHVLLSAAEYISKSLGEQKVPESSTTQKPKSKSKSWAQTWLTSSLKPSRSATLDTREHYQPLEEKHQRTAIRRSATSPLTPPVSSKSSPAVRSPAVRSSAIRRSATSPLTTSVSSKSRSAISRPTTSSLTPPVSSIRGSKMRLSTLSETRSLTPPSPPQSPPPTRRSTTGPLTTSYRVTVESGSDSG